MKLYDTFEKAKDLWIKHDYATLKTWLTELETVAEEAAEAYRPYGKQTARFNKKADAHFAEEEAIMKQRSTPKMLALYDLLRAISITMTTAAIFAWVAWFFDEIGTLNYYVIWLAFGFSTIASSSVSLYLGGFGARRQHPFPKESKKVAKENTARFKEYSDAMDAQTLVWAFSQIEEASALRIAFKKLLERSPKEAMRFGEDYAAALNSGKN